MTRLSWIIVLVLALAPAVRADQAPPEDPAAALLDNFTQALSPVGQWVDMDGLGWCWRPSAAVAGADFVPYATGGQWVLTADGWVFQSQWDWGDIVFHYGRWYEDENYGWLWVPGTEWGPAWVQWRDTSDYVGWAPLPPDEMAGTAPLEWLFVSFSVFAGPSAYMHSVSQADLSHIFSASVPCGARGPNPSTVQAAGVPVTVRPAVRPVTPVPVQPLPGRKVHLTPPARVRSGPSHRAVPASRGSSGHHR